MENSVIHNIVLDQGNQPAGAQTTTQAVPNPSDPRATWWLSIAQYLCNDLQSASLCDLVLQGRDGVVMAHGVVMAAVSPLIAAHLTLTTNKVVTFHLPEASHNTLTQLVHHVYQGSILLSRDSVEHFQAAANSIGMTQVNITIANSANFSQSGDTKVCHSESHGPDNLTSQEIVRIRCSNCGQGFADLHSYDKHVALETCMLRTTGQAVLNTKKDPLEKIYRICKIEPEWVRSITENSQPVSDIFSHQNADSAWDSKEMLPNVTDEVAGTIKNEMVEGQHIVPITAYSEDGLNRKKLSDKLTWRKELKHTKPFHCDRGLRSFTYKSSFEKHMTQACIRVRGPNSGAPTNLDSENKDLLISDKKTELSGSESDSEKSDQGLKSDSDYVESESDMDDDEPEEDQSYALSPVHQGRLGKWGKVVHALLSNEGTSSAKCPKCGILQTSIEDFEEHLKNSCDHSYGLKYVRATKLKLFEQYKNTDDVEKYVAMIKNDRRFRKSLKLEQYMKEESSNIRKGDNYNCNICGKEFVKRLNLRRHMYNYHKILRGFTCLKCNRKIRKKDECLSHIADHWVAEKFNLPFKPIFLQVNRCFICDQSLSTQEEIESHKQNCKVDQCVHICPICGLKFEGHYASASLKNHVRYVHDREPETCQICNAKVLTMTRHMRVVHSKDSQASFVCSHCGKNFNRRDNLRVHERIHTGDKPFSCNLCGQQFRLKCLLKSHQAHHA